MHGRLLHWDLSGGLFFPKTSLTPVTREQPEVVSRTAVKTIKGRNWLTRSRIQKLQLTEPFRTLSLHDASVILMFAGFRLDDRKHWTKPLCGRR